MEAQHPERDPLGKAWCPPRGMCAHVKATNTQCRWDDFRVGVGSTWSMQERETSLVWAGGGGQSGPRMSKSTETQGWMGSVRYRGCHVIHVTVSLCAHTSANSQEPAGGGWVSDESLQGTLCDQCHGDSALTGGPRVVPSSCHWFLGPSTWWLRLHSIQNDSFCSCSLFTIFYQRSCPKGPQTWLSEMTETTGSQLTGERHCTYIHMCAHRVFFKNPGQWRILGVDQRVRPTWVSKAWPITLILWA